MRPAIKRPLPRPVPHQRPPSAAVPSHLPLLMVIGLFVAVTPPSYSGIDPVTSNLGTLCQVDGKILDVLYQDGSWFLAGEFGKARPHGAASGVDEVTRRGVVACDAETGSVQAWDAELLETIPSETAALSLEVSKDGETLFIGGTFTTVHGVSRTNLAAVSTDDASLRPFFVAAPDRKVQSLLLSEDGTRLFVGGNFSTIGGSDRTRLAAVNSSTGNLDLNFAPSITGDSARNVRAMALGPEGETLFFGGVFDAVNGLTRNSVAGVDVETGSVTTGFAPDLSDPNPTRPVVEINGIGVFDGMVYLCGDWWLTEGEGGQNDQRNLNRFDPESGLADRTFWPNTNGGVQACAIDRIASVLYVGGHFSSAGDPFGNGGVREDLFAMDLEKNTVLDWQPGTDGISGVWGMELGAGALAVGGLFEIAGAAERGNAAAFETSREAILVVSEPLLPTESDEIVRRHLESLGFVVTTLRDDDVLGNELDTKTLGLITGTVSPSILGSKLASTETPIVVWQPFLFDELGLTLGIEGIDHGLFEVSAIDPIFSTHPVLRHSAEELWFDGPVDVAFGQPGGDGRIVAAGADGRGVMVTYVRDNQLADGSTAPGPRVTFPGYRSSFTVMGVEGWALFDKAIRFAVVEANRFLFGCPFERGDLTEWTSMTAP